MKKAIILFAVPTLFASCATIVSRTSYPMSINSNPQGATLSVTDKHGKEIFKGESPATVILSSGAGYFSKAEYQIKFSAPGYAEQIIPVKFTLNGWYLGNFIFGGPLGLLIIDPATGAMWKLDTPPVNVTLNKSVASETPTLKIIDVATVSQDMKKHLIRIK